MCPLLGLNLDFTKTKVLKKEIWHGKDILYDYLFFNI